MGMGEGMSRLRAAWDVLTGRVPVASTAVVAFGPNDGLLLESDGVLSADAIRRVQAGFRSVWPDVKVVVLDRGIRLRAVGKQ
jgi:hypothetical protein